ncbi:Bifunctional glutamate/proline--tRNA ligase [Trichinella spiralis]|uniref:Bifunctional glutamate/proline--tRNA ligase n=1 Tax=Trichinella spiralis TaxID=6334 RepID=A0A0V1B1R5_TRISP|nr:Bifunctional glutamate/proline--tRNA ligase [Trichinella spiralis]
MYVSYVRLVTNCWGRQERVKRLHIHEPGCDICAQADPSHRSMSGGSALGVQNGKNGGFEKRSAEETKLICAMYDEEASAEPSTSDHFLVFKQAHWSIAASIKWDKVTKIENDGFCIVGDIAVARYLFETFDHQLKTLSFFLNDCEIDSWVEYALKLGEVQPNEQNALLLFLEKYLLERKSTNSLLTLVGESKTFADYAVWSSLNSTEIKGKLQNFPTVLQYSGNIVSNNVADAVWQLVEKNCKTTENIGYSKKDEGKYVELPGAKQNEVVVRFPPEASGYLHIGHAKAAMLNQYYRDIFNGKLIMRFDDTNPAKETEEFEEVILDDLKLLQITPDHWSRTSDHFEQILKYCEQLLEESKAYVDDTEPDLMKQEREQRKESRCRNNSVKRNMELWEEMKNGTTVGQRCCVRLKIDMDSDNGCMRDPTIYRCKTEEHIQTKGKYKVYPTYDFACPIVDSIENVTHALRTTEYHDRDEQYFFILDALKLRKPHIYEYSRLNLMNTVMSKRKLTWLVNEGIVEGWDDPRLPTVRGVLRRGMTVEGLKQFIVAQGSSRSVVMMDWNKLWAFNRKVIDPIAPRYTALLKQSLVAVRIDEVHPHEKSVPKHPKNSNIAGEKIVYYGNEIFIEQEDANLLKENDTITLINWGNAIVKKVVRTSGKVTSAALQLCLENTNFKNTLKLTWLCEEDKREKQLIPIIASHFDNVISKAILGKDEDFKKFICRDSRHDFEMVGEWAMCQINKGDIVQLQRKGFYICDQPYSASSPYTGLPSPLILFNIPDGHVKDLPTGVMATKPASKKVESLQVQAGNVDKKSVVKMKEMQKKDKMEAKNDDLLVNKEVSLLLEIKHLGDAIRKMKSESVEKAVVQVEVEKLKQLKADYELVTGKKWTPNLVNEISNQVDQLAKNDADQANQPGCDKTAMSSAEMLLKIKEVGDEIRRMKSDGLKKRTTTATVETVESGTSSTVEQLDKLLLEIKSVGDDIRQMKSSGVDKKSISKSVEKLKLMKSNFEQLSGKQWTPDLVNAILNPPQSNSTEKKTTIDQLVEENKPDVVKKPPKGSVKVEKQQNEVKKITRLGLETTKEGNFSEWYSQVITKAEMIEYYDISGCYIIRPWAFAIWEAIQAWLDRQIKLMDVANCYFPMFVSQAALEREKSHVKGFSPEVAWVTKSGQSEMSEPVAIRPTSETVMYSSFSKWIQSHRDLPLKINQWCNIVRWEFKHPTPFLRSREFLWQEGHTAHANKDDAVKEVHDILDLYARVYEELLAVPVIKGRKTDKEKFAGADFTTTIEAYIPTSGRGIQAATSHHLGQNFSKMFDIVYEHPETQKKENVYQNSWGLTTRSIGVFTMIHSDNQGLVLPPAVAKVQVVIIPCGITSSLDKSVVKNIQDTCQLLNEELRSGEIRSMCDFRDNYSPGWKFNHWELKGVPLRMELGPRDLNEKQVTLVRRDDGSKMTVSMIGFKADVIKQLLTNIQNSLFSRAKAEMDNCTKVVEKWNDFCDHLEKRCLVMAPFCGAEVCEDLIKKDSTRDESTDPTAPSMGAKSLCIPFNQPKLLQKGEKKCVHPKCNQPAQFYTLFGRSY